MSTDPDTNTVDTLCPYCGVGCGLRIQDVGGGLLELKERPEYPVNRGALCSKGRNLHHTAMDRSDRLLTPGIRDRTTGEVASVSWEAAMDRICGAVKSAQAEHGPDSVAFYVSGQCLTEEYYLANKICKGFLGTNNIDTNSRLCMSSAVMGYKKTLGDDLVPCCYDDLDVCDCFLVAGANPSWCHPILWRRVEARLEANPDAKLIVVDPRRTETCSFAHLHLQPLPGTDCILMNAIASVLWDRGWVDMEFVQDHCTGWPELKAQLGDMTLAERAEACGVEAKDIVQAAEWIGESGSFMSLWTMGLNQSRIGTDKNIALIQLNLLTGTIGRPGCGPLSLTGQPNAMGGREVGGMATLLAAHHDPSSAEDRQKVADFWGVPSLPEGKGLTAMEIVEALEQDRLKVLWIMATNPLVSLPDQNRVQAALAKADLVVVQDFSSRADTLKVADVILPAATWLEKEGCMTNSERRISRVRKLKHAPGEAKADVEILLQFAAAMGWETSFAYESEEDIFAEYAELTRGTPIEITGVSYERLDLEGSLQWPCPEGGKGTSRLFETHEFATPNGKARLFPVPDHVPHWAQQEGYPYVLTTGRVRDQWHTMTRSGRVKRLGLQDPSPFLQIHPDDAGALGLEEGDPVRIRSLQGEAELPVRVSEEIRPGLVFAPMHWGRDPAGGKGLINRAVEGALDPVSLQPDFKCTPVQLEPVNPPAKRVVVVGAGAGALQFVQSYRTLRPKDEVLVIGREPRGFYNRILLPEYLTGELSWDDLVSLGEQEEAGLQFRFLQGLEVTEVDREQRCVRCSDGQEFTYDKLVLSTGSRAFVPPGVRVDLPGVFTMRTREDADRARERITPDSRVLVMGGGLLGIELAASLEAAGVNAAVIEMAPRLMMRQLDETAAALLKEELESRGIPVYTSDAVEEYLTHGDGSLAGVKTREGRQIEADLLFVAVGTRPNISYLETSGLEQNRGIEVNDHLQTSDPDIYALGEIAEHRGMLYGITDGAQKQAKVAAGHIAGRVWSRYEGSVLFNILKIHGRDVRSAGINEIPEGGEEDGWEDVLFRDRRRRIYQRCILQHNRLKGVQLIGDVSPWDRCKGWMDQGLELEEERAQLLRAPGAGAVERPPVKGKLVCSCNQVGEGNLLDAIMGGCTTLNDLCETTRAGTGCGSCRSQVKTLLERNLKTESIP